MLSARQVARFLISNSALPFPNPAQLQDGEIIDPEIRLATLLHIAQIFHIASTDSQLFSDNLLAGDLCGIVPGIWGHYQEVYGLPLEEPSGDDSGFLRAVGETLGGFRMISLLAMCMNDPAWEEAGKTESKIMDNLKYAGTYREKIGQMLKEVAEESAKNVPDGV